MFLKASAMETAKWFWNEGGVWDVLFKNILLADSLGNKHLFEILQTSLTFKNSENFVKSEYFINLLQWRANFFPYDGGI